jgi:hypothetical protein
MPINSLKLSLLEESKSSVRGRRAFITRVHKAFRVPFSTDPLLAYLLQTKIPLKLAAVLCALI